MLELVSSLAFLETLFLDRDGGPADRAVCSFAHLERNQVFKGALDLFFVLLNKRLVITPECELGVAVRLSPTLLQFVAIQSEYADGHLASRGLETEYAIRIVEGQVLLRIVQPRIQQE